MLTLPDALSAALLRSPELAAFSFEMRAREAETLQASHRPNPELRADVENVGGTGTREGFEDTETTLRLSQLVELGGKRTERQRVAKLKERLAGWDYKAKRLAVLSDVTKAFVATLAAQERHSLAAEMERLAGDALSATERSVAAGASAPVEATRARVALGRTIVNRAGAERELAAARSALAATWGAERATFSHIAGDLTRLEVIPSEESLRLAVDQNPGLARWKTERAERAASLALAEAARTPDVTIGAGGRHFSDNHDAALVFEVSVPLPLFNQNDGAIAAAEHRLGKAQAEQAAAEVSTRAALATAYVRLAAAHEQAMSLRDRVLPDAEASGRGAVDAFRKGLFRLVDVLEAQRTLFELRGDYLRVLEDFHVAAADIERLTGRPLGRLSEGGAQ